MAAAWVVKTVFPYAKFIPAQYGDKELITTLWQDCYENANINTYYIIVDFSFPRELMVMMNSKAKAMLVLDHHKTAQEACEGLDFCIFDMEQSGAGLAWRHYYKEQLDLGAVVPNLIKYIEDRDLWRFALKDSEKINAYIQSFPMDFDAYQMLYHELEQPEGLNIAYVGGESIDRYKKSMVDAMCNNAVFRDIGGYMVPTINATLLFSEVGHRLCQLYPDSPFAASFFIRQDGKMQYSLS
jgi:oligoribonuclease NrnB/cAMP/cGMP phosphodiesterase (DHH superfamily)